MTQKQKLIFVGILFLAIFFRFFLIGQLPGGLFPDEAAHGLDILSMQQGDLQPFYERGNGREALFIYMIWASVEAFGKGHWQHHIVSALVGLLSVIATFYATRQLVLLTDKEKNKERASWIALLAMFFMAVSVWHIVLSRTAFRAILLPLFTTTSVLALIKTFRANTKAHRYLWSIATGALVALGLYTYIGYRIFIPVMGIVVLWPMFVDLIIKPRFEQIKKFFVPTIFAAMAFLIVVFPIGKYFYDNPESFVGRSGQVSVFNEDLNQGDLVGVVLEVFRLTMKSFFWDGDLNWRHNVSGEPLLSIIISPFFAVGLLLTTYWAARYGLNPSRHRDKWSFFILAGWFWSMLLPVVTTAEGIPHGLRAIGVIPPVFIMSAWTLWIIKEQVQKFTMRFWLVLPKWKQMVFTIGKYSMLTTFVIALILQSYILYFVMAANSPENAYAFRSDLTVVISYLNESGQKDNTYLILDKFSVQTVDYLTTKDARNPNNPQNKPYIQVDPEDAWKLDGLKPNDQIVFTQSSIFDIKKFKQYHPNAKLYREDRNRFGEAVMAIYVIQ